MTIQSEFGRLRRVIVHRPGRALDLLRPRNIREKDPNYLLVDDLLYVPVAQAEHQLFCKVLAETAEVIYFTDLLSEILSDDMALRRQIAAKANLPVAATELPANELAEAVLSGEFNGQLYGVPCVNLLFTRDVGAVVGKAILLTYPRRFKRLAVNSPRALEMELMRLIFRRHALFQGLAIIDINEGRDVNDYRSIEGGDVFPLSKEVVAIGVSERTSVTAIRRAAKGIFQQGFEQILIVRIPKDRGSMHLDTVFSRPSPNECLIFEPVFRDGKTHVEILERRRTNTPSKLAGDFVSILQSVLGQNFTVYPCGGQNTLLAEREQWTDGANLLTLAPGVAVIYERNAATIEHLHLHGGYNIVRAEDFIGHSDAYLSGQKKAIIVIPSAELSRGRGGPRCMSLPLDRG